MSKKQEFGRKPIQKNVARSAVAWCSSESSKSSLPTENIGSSGFSMITVALWTRFFGDGLRDGSSGNVCDGLLKEWHGIVETVRNISECPECKRKPDCQYHEDSDRWIVSCKEGHLRADAAYVLPALENWNKNVGQYIQDHRRERLGRCLTEFWHREDTSDENLPEFMRQSWREKHADWEGK